MHILNNLFCCVRLFAELVHHVGNNVHDLGNQRTVLGDRHNAHVITLDDQERYRFNGSSATGGRGITLAGVTSKTEPYGYATYGNHRRFARLDRLANDCFRLGNEAEFFQKSFCKFFNSHIFNITKKINTVLQKYDH